MNSVATPKTQTVVVVTNIPRPYRRALFATLTMRLAAEGLGLRVLYTSDPSKHTRRGSPATTVDRPEAEAYVPGVAFRTGYERIVAIPTGLGRMMRPCAPACVVVGGFGVDAVMSALWCRRKRVPYVLWSGGWLGPDDRIGRLKSTIRRHLVQGAAAFVTYGTAAAEYLISFGADPNRVFCAWNTVDLEAIASVARAATARRSELADKYQLADKNLLFVGTLVERKGVRELVSAALGVEQTLDVNWALHFVGSGPLRDELEGAVQAAGCEARFRFHGLRPPEDVAELFGFADGCLLPTKREAWGLVINEAMACGVPTVVSPQAGATRDLIEHGVTGFVVEPTDIGALTAAISCLLSDIPRCKEIGRAGAEAVRAKASLEKAAGGFALAVLCALTGRRNG